MVCHCNCLPSDSSIPSSKACTSSGNKRLCTKLWAMRPFPTRTLAVVGSGLPSSWNVGYHPCIGREVDTTFILGWTVGSQMTIFPNGLGGVLVSASPESVEIYSDVHCLFRKWPKGRGGVGGGGGSLAMAQRWLLLRGWPGARNKTTNRHRPSRHHTFTLI